MLESLQGGAALYLLQASNGSDVWDGWGSVIFLVGGATLVAAIIIVIAWQVGNVARAAVVADKETEREQTYQALVDRTAAAQERTANQLQSLSEDVADLRVRVTSIERMLREVE